MFFELLIKGIVIGFLVSLPLGPIGVLIIQKTVNKNRTSGLMAGLGASLSDTIYAIIAGFSLSYIINFVKLNQLAFQIGGAIALIALGLNIFFKNPAKEIRKYRRKGKSYHEDFLLTFLITLSSPVILFLFIAAFTGSGVVFSLEMPYQTLIIIVGIYLGGAMWWTILTSVVSLFRHRFNLRMLLWFNKIAGSIIITLVIFALSYFLFTGKFI